MWYFDSTICDSSTVSYVILPVQNDILNTILSESKRIHLYRKHSIPILLNSTFIQIYTILFRFLVAISYRIWYILTFPKLICSATKVSGGIIAALCRMYRLQSNCSEFFWTNSSNRLHCADAMPYLEKWQYETNICTDANMILVRMNSENNSLSIDHSNIKIQWFFIRNVDAKSKFNGAI